MLSRYIQALETEQNFLLDQLLHYAAEAEFTRYASTKENDWRKIVQGPARSLIEYLNRHEVPEPIHIDEQFGDNPTIAFGIETARRHRERGVRFDMFFGLSKLVRQTFVDLVYRTSLSAADEKQALTITHRFFDKFEMGFTTEWHRQQETELLVELQNSNRDITIEKYRYQTIFKSMAEPAFVIDPQMRVLDGNAALEDFLSTSIDQLKGTLCRDLINCGLCEDCPLLKAIEEQHALSGIETTMMVNGAQKQVSMSVSFLDDVTGKYAGGVAVLQDITSRKQSEANLQFLSQITEQVADALIVTDLNYKIIYTNQAFQKIYGYDDEELYGQSPEILNVAPAADEIQQEIYQRVSSGNTFHSEVLNRKKDGSTFTCDVTIFPILDKEGNIFAYAGSQRDITERKRTSEELQKMEKLESVGVLAGGIAHDLNNLLTGIIGNISLAQMESDLLLKNRWLAEAENAAIRVKDLTQQLLTFSKGGLPVKKPTQLRNLLREFSTFALSGSNVNCRYSIADDLWHVEIDEGQISQVINNLMINAQQAMPQGGTVRIVTQNINLTGDAGVPLKAGPYVKISVRDHGVGIPRQHLHRIFDPFFSTKESSSGLGLATSYSIIQKHHGYLTVESQEGVGTTFYIYLPAAKKEISTTPASAEIDPKKGQGRILVMDDEKHLRDLTAEMLRILGYKAVTSRDGNEAIQIYLTAKESEKPFDAVILDLTIPGGMGGGETIQRLGKITPDVKAIVSSGYSNDPILSNFRDYGFSGVIAKPFRIRELAEVLRQVLVVPEVAEQRSSKSA